MKPKLADYEHTLVKETALRLTVRETTTRGKLEKLFYFVRDDIKFAFPKEGDFVKASETILSGVGQCNTKGTLFLALCKAIGIPVRIHFSLIRKDIQRGLFSGLAYALMPPQISHSWIEVEVEGKWRRIDSYINDEPFYQAAKTRLQQCGWNTGYSVACSSSASSSAFNLDEEKFVQMDAVTEDHGVWDDPADYYLSQLYKNRPGWLKQLLYRLWVGSINRKVAHLRNGYETTTQQRQSAVRQPMIGKN